MNTHASKVINTIGNWWNRFKDLQESFVMCLAYGSLVSQEATRFGPELSDVELTVVFRETINTPEKRWGAIKKLKEYTGYLELDLRAHFPSHPSSKPLVCITPLSSFEFTRAMHKDRKPNFWCVAEFQPVDKNSREEFDRIEPIREDLGYRLQNEGIIYAIEDVQRFRANFLRSSRDGTNDHLSSDYQSTEHEAISKNLGRTAAAVAVIEDNEKSYAADAPHGAIYLLWKLAEQTEKSDQLHATYNRSTAAAMRHIGVPLSREDLLLLWEYLYERALMHLTDLPNAYTDGDHESSCHDNGTLSNQQRILAAGNIQSTAYGLASQMALEPSRSDAVKASGIASLFDTKLPTIGQSEKEALEKFTLFGGRPIDLSMQFNAVEYAVAKHPFDRDIIVGLLEAIRIQGSSARSFTIQSLPGAGLSLALSQLVCDLFADADLKIFWIIDDPDRTRKVLSQLTSDAADAFYSLISARSPSTENILFVLDDVSKAPAKEIRNLITFRERCKYLANKQIKPRVTFVFGSFGAAPTCSEHEIFQLTLTQSDRTRCYKQMTAVSPHVLKGVEGGLDDILRSYPEGRWFENDAQAFIDFLLEHGGATAGAKKHWLARTDGLNNQDLVIFTTIAVSQLIGLHVEEAVAKRLFSSRAPVPIQDIEQIVYQVRGLALIQQEWKGLGLSCARRARSILERTGKFTFEFLNETYSEFVRVSLDHFSSDGHNRNCTLEFARHIFQRLSKNHLYRFEDKQSISRYLFSHHLDALRAASDQWNVYEKARWAGTLSAVLATAPGNNLGQDMFRSEAFSFVCRLCEDALESVTDHDNPPQLDILISLYRANRRLLVLARPDASSRIRNASKGLQYAISTDDFCSILRKELASNVDDPSYRGNELVHVRARFEDRLQGSKSRKFCESMSRLYSKVEKIFNDMNIALDAGNLLQRAQYVWIDTHASRKHQEQSAATKAEYLVQATACVKNEPFKQGTWGDSVSTAVKSFVEKNPAYAPYFHYSDTEGA